MAYFLMENLKPSGHRFGLQFELMEEVWLVDLQNEEMAILAIFHPVDGIWKKIQLTWITYNLDSWADCKEISEEEACLIMFEAE